MNKSENQGATPGATLSTTPGATPRHPPVNEGATYSPYTPRRCTPPFGRETPAKGLRLRAETQLAFALEWMSPEALV